MIMLLLLPLRTILFILLQPPMPILWWLSLCRFAYADKDNPTVISSNSKKKTALSFDHKLMILSQVQVKSEFAHLTPQLHRLHSSKSNFHKAKATVFNLTVDPVRSLMNLKQSVPLDGPICQALALFSVIICFTPPFLQALLKIGYVVIRRFLKQGFSLSSRMCLPTVLETSFYSNPMECFDADAVSAVIDNSANSHIWNDKKSFKTFHWIRVKGSFQNGR